MPRIKSLENQIGEKFGHWTLLEDLGRVYSRRLVKVKCVCEFVKYIDFSELKRGKSTNCGCQVKNNPLQWIGKRMNNITIIKILGAEKGKTRVQCICDCGTKRIIRFDSLMSGSTKSCGCLKDNATKTHGLRGHPLYSVWSNMRGRCNDENDKAYKNYGGVDVKVCAEWNDFKVFYEWCMKNGWKKGLQLDKDILASELPGKLYSPDTCCFVTRKENMNCTSQSVFIDYKGCRLTMTQWSEKLQIPYHLIRGRLRSGWSIEDIFTLPVDKKYSKNYRT